MIYLIFIAIGAVLATAGIGITDWQLYALLTLAAVGAVIGEQK